MGAREVLVHVHRVEQRLIESRLELLSNNKETVFGSFKVFAVCPSGKLFMFDSV